MSHILVIDDDAAIRDLLSYYLTRKGYSVAVAENGLLAERQIEERRPDLVISDILMPEADGLEFLMKVKARLPVLPVIAISGGIRGANYDPLPVAKKLGARHVLSKPLDLNQLLDCVRDVLEVPRAET